MSIVIIGGSSGIGRQTAAWLLERGESVVIASRTRWRQAQSELGCPAEELEASSFEAVEALLKRHAPVTGLVCAAGSILLKPAHLTSESDYAETLRLNLQTAFATVRAAGKHMQEGSVVLFSSVAAGVGLANHEAISAAKAGVEGLMRSAAATYVGRGLRFNAVSPALVDTPMADKLLSRPATRSLSEAMIPMGRVGTAREVAELVAWLLSAQSSWMTGQVLSLDGGMSRLRIAPRP